MTQGNMQIGKNGLTPNFIETMRNHFKKHKDMKIRVLKNIGHKKENIKKHADEILEKLGNRYTAKVVGFTIFVKKWRKPVRQPQK